MNCIEWLVRGLEISGIQIPENILTATSLLNWASKNLKFIKKKKIKKISDHFINFPMLKK